VPKGILAVKRAMEEIGCHDVDLISGKHYQLRFSYEGKKANPIFVSKTPSDLNVSHKIAGDVVCELKRLGASPSVYKNVKARICTMYASPGVPSILVWGNYWKRKKAWDRLEALAAGKERESLSGG
jgi:hypothetical protein